MKPGNKKFYIGVDVGGTSIKFGIFDYKKDMIDSFSIATVIREKNSENAIINDISNAIYGYCSDNKYNISKNKICGIGFAIPGSVVNNVVLKAININWTKKLDLVKITKNKLGKNINVKVYNDANAAALGEYTKYLNKKYKSICFVTLGTGVGTGIIINGKLIEGRSGAAGEFSHIRVDNSDEAIKCNCGNIGCLETVLGVKGTVNVYKRINNIEDLITAKQIIDNAKNGDKKSLIAIEKSLDYLSYVLATAMLIYEPEVIVIGGGFSNAGSFITDIIIKKLKEKVFITKVFPKIIIAKLKNNAGVYGSISEL